MNTIFIALAILVISCISNADLILSVGTKYGPNGYRTSGDSSYGSSVTRKQTGHNGQNVKVTTVDSSSSSLEVGNRLELVPGFKVQTVPEMNGGLSIGIGYYTDQTAEVFLGIRL